MAQVRYIVDDVDRAITFYTSYLGFALEQQFGPAMAILKLDDLKLWIAGPMASASKPMPDGSKPEPGGWGGIVVQVKDLSDKVSQLRQGGLEFKNDILEGPGGKQILCIDPSGNLVELFEAA
ncbi:MAG: VOC family protein [Alphaproteobacteria bacterium]|nr:VOC family protein [Alphaproteobacteria bacterium]